MWSAAPASFSGWHTTCEWHTAGKWHTPWESCGLPAGLGLEVRPKAHGLVRGRKRVPARAPPLHGSACPQGAWRLEHPCPRVPLGEASPVRCIPWGALEGESASARPAWAPPSLRRERFLCSLPCGAGRTLPSCGPGMRGPLWHGSPSGLRSASLPQKCWRRKCAWLTSRK